MKKFWIRTASSVIYVALFVGTMLSGKIMYNDGAGTIVFLLFLLFAACGCTFEFYRIARLKSAKPIKWMGYLAVCMIILLFSILILFFRGFRLSEVVYSILGMLFIACVLLVLPLSAVIQLWRGSERPFGDIGYTLLPVFYIAIPFASMVFMQMLNVWLLLLVVVLVWINDACAYMLGSLFGRHKMWTKHSPGKTWEGTVSGVIIATVAGTVAAGVWSVFELSMWQGALLGLTCGVIGTLGDLVESMLKRSAGLKDSGRAIPGHGGFLDRFDSLLILLPFATVIIVLFII